jgi:hypothetical protein
MSVVVIAARLGDGVLFRLDRAGIKRATRGSDIAGRAGGSTIWKHTASAARKKQASHVGEACAAAEQRHAKRVRYLPD